jgi:zinc protease
MKNLLVLIGFLILGMPLRAQHLATVPLDERIESGQLSNGLKYYIMPNKKPENRVELRLVVNAGSVLESPKQLGLAHFCEHMAFNGSKNFKKNELVDYLQSAGVKFGAHLNAYTSFDETVYMLSLPLEDKEILENGFQILEDWAHNLSFDSLEIEKERGVVLEEYRLGLGAQKRMMASYLPKVLYKSAYAERLPIGKKEILENFKKEAITDFYRDWYRPDLMAVIVVGDIDKKEAKTLITSHFSSLKNPANSPERFTPEVPDHNETFVTTVTDPEATYGTVQVAYKLNGLYKRTGTIDDYNQGLKQRLFYSMLNDRISEKTKKPGAAFTTAYVYQGELWVRNKEAVQAFAIVGGGKYIDALKQVSTEIQRAKEHGFVEMELQRAKINMRTSLERAYKESNKTESRRYAGRLVNTFLTQSPLSSPEWALKQYDEFVKNITLNDLNDHLALLIRSENRVITMTGPEAEKDQMPDEALVISTLDQVQHEGTSPYEELLLPESLITSTPQAGTVVSSSLNEAFNTQTLTLSNGVKVILKKTDLKNDQILFRILSRGGTNMVDDEIFKAITYGMGVISRTGVGEFSDSDLDKILAGKSVRVSPFIGSTSEGMSGSCRPQDAEEMMQLIHLYFVQPRLDQEAYEAYVNRQRSFYDNIEANPSSYYNIQLNKWKYKNHPRGFNVPKEEDWQNTQYPMIHETYMERFANAADFTFVFVGNIDDDSFTTLVTQYLASLPANESREETKDLGLRVRTGTEKFAIHKGAEPKSMVQISFSDNIPYDKHEDLALDMAAEVLTIKLIEVLREQMGGVYGTSARNYFSRLPNPSFTFSIGFPCGPDNVDTLIQAALAEVKKLANAGPSQKDVDKVKQTMIKTLKTDAQSNRFWLNQLVNWSYYDDDLSSAEQMEEKISAMTIEDIKNAVNKRLTGDYLTGVLYPE